MFLFVKAILANSANYEYDINISFFSLDNILRHVFDNGRTVYKIADFGAARELHEGECFESLHGTAAYLHPDLYEYHLNREIKPQRKFDSKMDLWSIGVTLFHIATGSLPFQIKDYRKKREIFAKMTEGDCIISAEVDPISSEVSYYRGLPAHCQMSEGLKELIVPLIAGLLSLKLEGQWDFLDFHTHAMKIINKQIIKIFYVNRMKLLKIYINSTDSVETFQKSIRHQTNIPEHSQIFFYKRDFSETFQVLPKTDFDTEYIFLLNSTIGQIIPRSFLFLQYSALDRFKNTFMTHNKHATCYDTELIHTLLKYLYEYLIIMKLRSEAYKAFDLFMEDFSLFIENRRGMNEVEVKHLMYRTDCVKRYTSILDGPQSAEVSFLERKFNTMTEKINLIPIDFVKKDAVLHESYYKALYLEIDSVKPLYEPLAPNNYMLTPTYDFEKIKFFKCFKNIVGLLKKMDPIFKSFIENKKSWYLNTFLPYLETVSSTRKMLNKDIMELQEYETDLIFNASLRTEKRFQNYDQLLKFICSYRKNSVDTCKLVEESEAIISKMSQFIAEMKHFG